MELGTASDKAGESWAEYSEPSAGCAETDAEESIGLVTEGCVKLGDDVMAEFWSGASDDEAAVEDIDGAVGAAG